MGDYGHELVFGTFLTPRASDVPRVIALAGLTEQVGLDLVTVQDHPYQARFVDAWTLLSVIAARTTRLRVAPNVANLPLRPPSVLARSVASLDLLSGGRVELGLGAGAFWDGVAAMGGRRLSPREAVDALAEAIEVIRAMWQEGGQSVKVDGAHHRVHGAHPGPSPAHDVEIWVGAIKPRMLDLVGRVADGWLPSLAYVPPTELADKNARIDDSTLEAGRKPQDVRRLYNISGRFGSGNGYLDGPPELWVEQLSVLALDRGMSTFILGSDDPDTIRRFAAEVVPALRDVVDLERTGGDRRTDQTPERETVRTATTTALPSALGVEPTPDDGARRSSQRAWDESTRPTGPAPDPQRAYTAHERATGQHLVDVHDGLRAELEQLRGLIEQVAAGRIGAGEARSHIATMTMRQNSWTLGAYCESYCRIVTTHHTIEDVSMLPHLRARDPRLAHVIDRLENEHHVIHELLERVDRALVALVGEEDGALDGLRAAVDLLGDALLSHLSYEERELLEPLARLGMS